jgi:N-acetylglutamate synthase-like GNAT family acetyltransferase
MTAIKPFSVHWLTAVETPLANHFYHEYHFRGKARRHEPCAVVRNQHNAIIACAYLRDYSSADEAFSLLAGVAVAPDYQGQGVARLLLKLLTERFDTHTYTFPYEHLRPFYSSLGFQSVADLSQDSVVSDVYRRYREQGRSITVMRYAPFIPGTVNPSTFHLNKIEP